MAAADSPELVHNVDILTGIVELLDCRPEEQNLI